MPEGTEKTGAGDGAGAEVKVFRERAINASGVVWQALAAVIDGKDDAEAKKRLEALTIEELRTFRFEVDRIRTLVYNVQGKKMRDADASARSQHQAEVKQSDGE